MRAAERQWVPHCYGRSPGWQQEQISENRFGCGVVARAMFPRDQAGARRFAEWREQNWWLCRCCSLSAVLSRPSPWRPIGRTAAMAPGYCPRPPPPHRPTSYYFTELQFSAAAPPRWLRWCQRFIFCLFFYYSKDTGVPERNYKILLFAHVTSASFAECIPGMPFPTSNDGQNRVLLRIQYLVLDYSRIKGGDLIQFSTYWA